MWENCFVSDSENQENESEKGFCHWSDLTGGQKDHKCTSAILVSFCLTCQLPCIPQLAYFPAVFYTFAALIFKSQLSRAIDHCKAELNHFSGGLASLGVTLVWRLHLVIIAVIAVIICVGNDHLCGRADDGMQECGGTVSQLRTTISASSLPSSSSSSSSSSLL